jgi:hypothetical protein
VPHKKLRPGARVLYFTRDPGLPPTETNQGPYCAFVTGPVTDACASLVVFPPGEPPLVLRQVYEREEAFKTGGVGGPWSWWELFSEPSFADLEARVTELERLARMVIPPPGSIDVAGHPRPGGDGQQRA